MASLTEYRDDYERCWSSLRIRPERLDAVRELAQRLSLGRPRYRDVEVRTGVPWWFVGLCHYREASFDFDSYLGNGQPLDRRTTLVPKGRGPFTGSHAFRDGAIDALRLRGLVGVGDWSIARVLFRLEGFNGYGYHGKGVNSPYLWGGSTAYGPPNAPGGKFVRDHVFDPNVIDPQLGTAVILRALLDLDATIVLDVARPVAGDAPREPDDEVAESTLWVQQALNRLGIGPFLAEDGRNGPRTMTRVAQFQARRGLDDTGLADARTVAALQEALRPGTGPDGALRARTDAAEGRPTVEAAATARTVQPAMFPPAGLPHAAPSVDLAERLDDLIAALRRPIADARIAAVPPGPAAGVEPRAVPRQVNGALGRTVGRLLDGRKSAIGIVGAVATQILSQIPQGTDLGQTLARITPDFGDSRYTMPIFLGLIAWGVLGKLEKWSHARCEPAPQTTSSITMPERCTNSSIYR